jgi:hypothetical protein
MDKEERSDGDAAQRRKCALCLACLHAQLRELSQPTYVWLKFDTCCGLCLFESLDHLCMELIQQ